MKSKMYQIVTAFLLLFWNSGSVMGQFVNIRLELPAGVNFESQIIKTNLLSQGEEIVWIEMVAQENLTFILTGSQKDSVEVSSLPVYFLNDGSNNFHLAKKYSGSVFSALQIHPSRLLIRELKPPVWRLNAWIGLPNTKNVIYSIEYP